MSPTARSLQELRKQGYVAEVVERRLPIPGKFVTQDFLGGIDILAISERVILGVQATTDSNMSSHITKAANEPRLRVWLKAGGQFQIWAWGKHGKRGKRKIWTLSKRGMYLCGENIGWMTPDD